MRTFLSSTLFALTLMAPLPALAASLPKPSGAVVLTVEGNITKTNAEGRAEFDLAMIDALPQRVTVTETPWHEGTQTFSGPLAAALLDAVGAQGTLVTVQAINDYSAEIPVDDLIANPVILASRMNGETLSIRDRGPLFVIYPFDEMPSLYNEVYFGRSVWQVVSITVH